MLGVRLTEPARVRNRRAGLHSCPGCRARQAHQPIPPRPSPSCGAAAARAQALPPRHVASGGAPAHEFEVYRRAGATLPGWAGDPPSTLAVPSTAGRIRRSICARVQGASRRKRWPGAGRWAVATCATRCVGPHLPYVTWDSSALPYCLSYDPQQAAATQQSAAPVRAPPCPRAQTRCRARPCVPRSRSQRAGRRRRLRAARGQAFTAGGRP